MLFDYVNCTCNNLSSLASPPFDLCALFRRAPTQLTHLQRLTAYSFDRRLPYLLNFSTHCGKTRCDLHRLDSVSTAYHTARLRSADAAAALALSPHELSLPYAAYTDFDQCRRHFCCGGSVVVDHSDLYPFHIRRDGPLVWAKSFWGLFNDDLPVVVEHCPPSVLPSRAIQRVILEYEHDVLSVARDDARSMSNGAYRICKLHPALKHSHPDS
jgi:hypothetical protein